MAVQQGGDPLVEIGDPSALWIVADVFERDLPLRPRRRARRASTLPSVTRALEGRVASVGAVVASGLADGAGAHHPRPAAGAGLRPGMYGRVAICDVRRPPDVSLPTEAVLIKDGKDPVVYVAEGAR